jgi:hypothetical protein
MDNIKMEHNGWGWKVMDWIYLAQKWSSGWNLKTRRQTVDNHQMVTISWPAQQVLGYQEGSLFVGLLFSAR